MADAREKQQFLANAVDVVGPWSVHDDDDGRLFYFNHDSCASQWDVPSELAGLEGEFMMALMLQDAIATSGVWTAHDAGNATLYYFNRKTRVSVWERPAEWGDPALEAEAAREAMARKQQVLALLTRQPAPPKEPEREERKASSKTKTKTGKNKNHEEQNAKRKDEEQHVATPAPPEPTAEELELRRRREEEAERYRERFREMLRDKKVMPFTKWSVAFPSIATDPRFLAVPTMDERRDIFEDFVKNRRDDLKNEKKQKLQTAKKRFVRFLREQLHAQRVQGTFDANQSFSVFLAALEQHEDGNDEQQRELQTEVLALLPFSVQEKIWSKVMEDFLESTKAERDEEDRLMGFLLEKLAGWELIATEDPRVRAMIRDFYGSQQALLSDALQSVVVQRVAKKVSEQRKQSKSKAPTPMVPSATRNELAPRMKELTAKIQRTKRRAQAKHQPQSSPSTLCVLIFRFLCVTLTLTLSISISISLAFPFSRTFATSLSLERKRLALVVNCY
ncbi:hypothetical protein PINS_up008131 [Pythium insidiosum]|nr:hypothetical protein PINS_up008131 [Pythium insidiosum]